MTALDPLLGRSLLQDFQCLLSQRSVSLRVHVFRRPTAQAGMGHRLSNVEIRLHAGPVLHETAEPNPAP
jgi:hypothetical protein